VSNHADRVEPISGSAILTITFHRLMCPGAREHDWAKKGRKSGLTLPSMNVSFPAKYLWKEVISRAGI
jgi:hypothetical protein